MSSRAKTIQIYLPDGDPHGIREAELTTRIVKVIEVPRSILQNFLKMPESSQVGVYFLLGSSDDGSDSKVYIGQTGDLSQRLNRHNRDKDFWDRVVVLISKTNSLTTTHALFLEWHCLQEARKAGRFSDENGNSGSRPHIPAPLEADCLEIFETAQTLLSTLGFPLFDALSGPSASSSNSGVFTCSASGANGRGIYNQEGFVVLKDSSGRIDVVDSFIGSAGERLRSRLIETAIMRVDGDRVFFEKDHLFKSPSTASSVLLGRSSNGWMDWRDAQNKTLSSVIRGT